MFNKAKNPKIKAALVLKVALYLYTPSYFLKEALQVVSCGDSAAYFLRKIIEVKRIIKLILEAFDGSWFFMLPTVNEYTEFFNSILP